MNLNRFELAAIFLIIVLTITLSGSLLLHWIGNSSSSESSIDTNATVQIETEVFNFNPTRVETRRPDLFKTGHFSMFDILVHLDEGNKKDLTFHFDASLNTYVIDSINGEES